MFSNNNWLLNLALPGFEVSEPLVGSVIAKGFIGGGRSCLCWQALR